LDQAKEADLVILPEIWNVGYFAFDLYAKESEPIDGETARRMSAKAKEHGFYLHAGSMVEREGEKLYNTSLLFDPHGNLVARYRKIHLYGYESRESQILSRGNEVVVVQTSFGKIECTVTIYDFPNFLEPCWTRALTSSWSPQDGPTRLEHWLMFNRIQAIENTAFLISSNGGINRCPFCGHSMMVDPWGSS
jgi:predicted amidohydrolase